MQGADALGRIIDSLEPSSGHRKFIATLVAVFFVTTAITGSGGLHFAQPRSGSAGGRGGRGAVCAGTPATRGSAGADSVPCRSPPGATSDGCVVSGRLSPFKAKGNAAGPEQVLINDWCQQFPSHSTGSLAFGPAGMLYSSAGDGASFNYVDYGQAGNPKNPCGDPPGGVGGTQTPPTAEGGALRSQVNQTTFDPTSFDGAILSLFLAIGAAAIGNQKT